MSGNGRIDEVAAQTPRRASVRSSSAPANRLYPTTSATRIATSLRVSLIAPLLGSHINPNASPSLPILDEKDRSWAHSFRTEHQVGRSPSGRGCVKTPRSFHTLLVLACFRGLWSIRSRKNAKKFRLCDRSHFFGDFLHGLGRFEPFATPSGMAANCAFRPKTRVASGPIPAICSPIQSGHQVRVLTASVLILSFVRFRFGLRRFRAI